MLSVFYIACMSCLARAAGGGLGAEWLVYGAGTKLGAFWGKVASKIPEIIIALVITYFAIGVSWWALLVALLSYAAVEIGHGNAYHMGFLKDEFEGRWQSLDYIVRPVAKWFGFENRTAGYCWLFMGLKGLLIGLPLAPYGAWLAVLWPASYYISFKKTRDSMWAEYLSGGFLGLTICLGF